MKTRPILCIVCLIALMGCAKKEMPKMSLQGLAQGSYYAITYYDSLGRDFQPQIDSIFALVDQSVSLWNDSSVISKVNRNEEVELDQIFIDNFNLAQWASSISDGYFDASISPLVAAWGFSYKTGDSITPILIDSLKKLVDYRKIHIVDHKLIKENPAMSLDFNSVAQGYTSDMIASFLQSQGVKNYLVDTGGEIMAQGGKPDGNDWVVGIEKPAENWDSERVVQTKVKLRDKGLVTSGSYRKYVEREGKRYSHTINPKTGYPVEHNLLSVSVIADNSATADALASVFMVLGMEKALQLLPSLEQVEAYFIYVDANNALQTYSTDGFQTLILD